MLLSALLIHINVYYLWYHPAFDLGIGEEWLPKHPLAGDDNADDAEFWQSIGAIEHSVCM